jgi:esterase/lipase superfamily enzyme
MRRDYHNWYSSRVNRHMELLAYGHSGLPLLVFPSSMGKFYEYEDRGMINAIWQRIENGNLQVFCVDSFDQESWYNKGLHPHDRVARHVQFEDYILYEVLPLIRQLNSTTALCVTGCSFGAYHSMNFALKHPDVVTHCVAMSGSFDMKPFLNGYFDELCYFNSPADFVPDLNDAWFLDRYRQMKLILAAGDWDICLGENFRMAQILGTKGIPHWLDVWTGGLKHDWPLWQGMAAKFF